MWLLLGAGIRPPSEGDEKLCSICVEVRRGGVQWVCLRERMKKETSQITLDPGLTRGKRALLKEPLLIFMYTYIAYTCRSRTPHARSWTKSMENFVHVRIILTYPLLSHITQSRTHTERLTILNGPRLQCEESITNYCTPMFSYQ